MDGNETPSSWNFLKIAKVEHDSNKTHCNFVNLLGICLCQRFSFLNHPWNKGQLSWNEPTFAMFFWFIHFGYHKPTNT